MGNFLGNILGGLEGAATGMLTAGPPGAIAGGISGIINGGGGPSGIGNISPQTDPTIALSQGANRAYEYATFVLNAEQMRHQLEMQVQTNQFNDVQDEKSEQMREINTLREVSMKQREADDKIVKSLSRRRAASSVVVPPSQAAQPSSPRDAGAPLLPPGLAPPSDIDMLPDSVSTLAEAFSKRAELMMLTQQSRQQELQLKMDRMKADFNAAQEQRSEALREMNALRDMAVEQSKKDDEILKKYIAMI